MHKIKALVSGGLGFIGTNLVEALVQLNYEVVVIDDLSTGRPENRVPGVKYLLKSINNRDFLQGLFFTQQFDVVIHLAAWARVQRSVDDPLGTNAVNTTGTLCLLETCRKFGIKNIIYASSSSVYGRKETHIMDESMNTEPLSPYAVQKLHGEQWGRLYSSLYGMNFMALRFFNVYGPRQLVDGPYSLVIGKFIQQKRAGRKLTIYGDGKQTRAYTYVSDVVNAIVRTIQLLKAGTIKGFEAINIGTDEETSVNELAKLIGGEVEHIMPNPRGDVEEQRKSANYEKATRLLGWIPQVKIVDGIKLTLKENA